MKKVEGFAILIVDLVFGEKFVWLVDIRSFGIQRFAPLSCDKYLP
jgi:hypothetical protein